MMKRLFTIVCGLFPLLALAQEKPYTIKGQLGPYNNPVKVYLHHSHEGKSSIDSTQLIKGNFEFSGMIGRPEKAWLAIPGRGMKNNPKAINYHVFYLEPGLISVQSRDSTSNVLISGTPLNDSWEELQGIMKDTVNRVTMTKVFVLKNASSVIAVDAIYGLQEYGFKLMDSLYQNLSSGLKRTEMGQVLAAKIIAMEHTQIGSLAVDFAMADTAGNTISLSGFRGKYVLLDFWASWCAPCRAENPNLVKTYQTYKDKNFKILGVSLDRPGKKAAWINAIHKDQLEWDQVSDLQFWDCAAAKLYDIRSIPNNFLIGPDGKIIAKNLRGKALDEKLAAVFGQ
jgi:peroxiredoxin